MKRHLQILAERNPELRRHIRPVMAAMNRRAQLSKALERVSFADAEKVWARAFGESLEKLVKGGLGSDWVVSTFYGTSGGFQEITLELEVPRQGPFLSVHITLDDQGINAYGEEDRTKEHPFASGVRSTSTLAFAVTKLGREIADWALSV